MAKFLLVSGHQEMSNFLKHQIREQVQVNGGDIHDVPAPAGFRQNWVSDKDGAMLFEVHFSNISFISALNDQGEVQFFYVDDDQVKEVDLDQLSDISQAAKRGELPMMLSARGVAEVTFEGGQPKIKVVDVSIKAAENVKAQVMVSGPQELPIEMDHDKASERVMRASGKF